MTSIGREKETSKSVSNLIEVEAYAQIPDRTLAITRSRNWKMVWNARLQARRFVEPVRKNDNA